jgi:hypothetical protein
MEVIELSGVGQWKVSFVRGQIPNNLTQSALINLPATVPGSIQMDLLTLNITEDPYKFGEELKQRWMGILSFVNHCCYLNIQCFH